MHKKFFCVRQQMQSLESHGSPLFSLRPSPTLIISSIILSSGTQLKFNIIFSQMCCVPDMLCATFSGAQRTVRYGTPYHSDDKTYTSSFIHLFPHSFYSMPSVYVTTTLMTQNTIYSDSAKDGRRSDNILKRNRRTTFLTLSLPN
jgi:hypothetical protein